MAERMEKKIRKRAKRILPLHSSSIISFFSLVKLFHKPTSFTPFLFLIHSNALASKLTSGRDISSFFFLSSFLWKKVKKMILFLLSSLLATTIVCLILAKRRSKGVALKCFLFLSIFNLFSFFFIFAPIFASNQNLSSHALTFFLLYSTLLFDNWRYTSTGLGRVSTRI